ncbi:MAG: 3-coathanger stack domain-containing protein [Bacteroidia bacterium]
MVYSNSDVTFVSCSEILLNPGFEVQPGAAFTALTN